MEKRIYKNKIQLIKINLSSVLPALIIIIFGLGFSGFIALGEDEGLYAIHSAALKSLQLFILSLGPADLGNWQTRLASILAPLTTVSAAFVAYSKNLRSWRQWNSMHINPAHDLYLGGGKAAAVIAKNGTSSSIKQARKQVAIDIVQNTALNEVFNNLKNCFVLQGDALNYETLQKANIKQVERVWVATGDDQRNISILQNLILTDFDVNEKKDSIDHSAKATRSWFVEITSSDIVRLSSALFKSPPGVAIEYFNIERIAARRLIQEFVKNYLPRFYKGSASSKILHLCFVGSSELAEALILQGIQQLVISENPKHCLRITWIASDATERMRRLKQKIPVLGDSSSFSDCFSQLLPLAVINCIDQDELNISPAIWVESQKELDFTAAYIVCNDELMSVGAMLRIIALRDVQMLSLENVCPVVVCHWEELPKAAIEAPINEVSFFHITGKIFQSDEYYPGENLDELAKFIHASYSVTTNSQRPENSFVEKVWTGLSEPSKWSSRMSADHAAVKHVLITNSCDLNADQNSRSNLLTQEEVERNIDFLASIEHRRFVVERLIDGWLPLGSNVTEFTGTSPSGLTYSNQKSLLRLNSTLVSYDQLPDGERLKIIPSIRALPKLISWVNNR